MEKRIIRTGLVGSLKSDFEAAGGSFEANLKKRLRMLCVRPGPRYDEESKLSLTPPTLVGSSYLFSVSSVGLVVFPGFDFYCPDSFEDLTAQISSPAEPGYWYVMLHKVVTDSAPGEFMPGYPEDDDDYTMRTISVELVVTDHYERGENYVPLYKVYYDGSSWDSEYTDYRNDVCLLLSSDTNISVDDLEVTGLSVVVEDISTLQDIEAVYNEMEEATAIYPFNTMSHNTNALRNPSLMKITWDAVDRDQSVWCYEIRVAPYVNGEPNIPHAVYDIVMANQGQYTRSYSLQAIKSQNYSISVRAVSSSLARVVGNWTTVMREVTVSSSSSSLLIPTTLTLEALGNFPKTYSLEAFYYDLDSIDAMAVRRTVTPSWGNAFKDIVHYGHNKQIVVTVPPYSTCTFAVKALMKDGTDTAWSEESPPVSAQGPPTATARSKQIAIPMHIRFTDGYYDDPIGRFVIPDLGASGARLVKATLHAWGMVREKSATLERIDILLRKIGGSDNVIMQIDNTRIATTVSTSSFSGYRYEQTLEEDGLSIEMTSGDTWSLRAAPGGASPTAWAIACGVIILDIEPYNTTSPGA